MEWQGIAQCAFEVCVGFYAADLISGVVHMYLDYQNVQDKRLRLHVENSIPAVVKFEENDDLFKNASPMDQYLWNFHVHHDAPYPSKDTEFELVMQILRPLFLPLLGLIYIYHLGYMSNRCARIVFGALSVGPFMQKLHFLAHARNHGVLQNKTVGGAILCFLQDYGIILSAKEHKRHHEEFDVNFCIVNGWANPLLNRVRVLLSWVGILASEPPTAVARRERAEEEAHEAEQKRLASKIVGEDINAQEGKPLLAGSG
jgi:hypothetical protein